MPTQAPDQGPWLTPPTSPRPRSILDQLRWVHDLLRRDLETVRELAAAAADRVPAADLRARLADLQSNGPLFQLRVNCLTYCQTLHSHHRGEDDILFPALRRTAPQLASTIDRLEDDHRLVLSLLTRIEIRAQDLEAAHAREDLVEALGELANHLAEHLMIEEEALEPVLRGWEQSPDRVPPEIRERATRG